MTVKLRALRARLRRINLGVHDHAGSCRRLTRYLAGLCCAQVGQPEIAQVSDNHYAEVYWIVEAFAFRTLKQFRPSG